MGNNAEGLMPGNQNVSILYYQILFTRPSFSFLPAQRAPKGEEGVLIIFYPLDRYAGLCFYSSISLSQSYSALAAWTIFCKLIHLLFIQSSAKTRRRFLWAKEGSSGDCVKDVTIKCLRFLRPLSRLWGCRRLNHILLFSFPALQVYNIPFTF